MSSRPSHRAWRGAAWPAHRRENTGCPALSIALSIARSIARRPAPAAHLPVRRTRSPTATSLRANQPLVDLQRPAIGVRRPHDGLVERLQVADLLDAPVGPDEGDGERRPRAAHPEAARPVGGEEEEHARAVGQRLAEHQPTPAAVRRVGQLDLNDQAAGGAVDRQQGRLEQDRGAPLPDDGALGENPSRRRPTPGCAARPVRRRRCGRRPRTARRRASARPTPRCPARR